MMKRHFVSNLSPEDLRTYRRWTQGCPGKGVM